MPSQPNPASKPVVDLGDWGEAPLPAKPAPPAKVNGSHPPESFDTATPVRPSDRMFIRPPEADLGDKLPHDTEAEEQVLGAILLDPDTQIDAARAAGITTRSFYDSKHATVLACAYALHDQNEPVDAATVAASLRAQGTIERIGGFAFITQVTRNTPTSAVAAHFMALVRSLEIRRGLIMLGRLAAEMARGNSDAGEVLEEISSRLKSISASTPSPILPRRPIFDFPLIPHGHPSILLGNRYLNRGDIGVLVGSSGMGKSSGSIQMAIELAIARGPFGIQGNGPLRSLILQSEDSDGDVAEVAHSVAHVLKLTSADRAAISNRVHVVTDRIHRGQRFIDELRGQIQIFKPDIVWINPLQAFIDGDITDSKDIGRFLREGLNSLNEPATFGYMLVHHTTKPASGKDKADRQWHEVMYDMAGGAEIINSARAIISLRATPEEGNFNLVLAKRGRRAGVTRTVPQGVGFVLEPVTTIPIRHAKGFFKGPSGDIPIIFWEPRDPDPVSESKATTGRESKYDYQDFRNIMPPKSSRGLEIGPLWQMLQTNGNIGEKKNLGNVMKRWERDGWIEIISDPGIPRRYRAAI